VKQTLVQAAVKLLCRLQIIAQRTQQRKSRLMKLSTNLEISQKRKICSFCVIIYHGLCTLVPPRSLTHESCRVSLENAFAGGARKLSEFEKSFHLPCTQF